MKRVAVLLMALLAFQPTMAYSSPQRAMTPAEEHNGWRDAARAMPTGVSIKVELANGRRIRGTLMSISGDELLIKERDRSSRPALVVPFADVVRIERVDHKGPNIVKAVATGAAAGAGAFVAFLAFALIVFDD